MFTLKDTGFSIKEEDVVSFEKRRGIALPQEYRNFLISTNGGHINGSAKFDISEDEGGGYLVQFYKLRDKIRSSETLDYMLDLRPRRLPKGIIMIAGEGTGGKICIGVSENYEGRVFFWDPELDFDDTEDGSFEGVVEVASGFSDFIRGLK